MTKMLNRFALCYENTGHDVRVFVAEITSQVDDVLKTDQGDVGRHRLITRSEDQERMITLKTLLNNAWASSAGILKEGNLKVKVKLEEIGAAADMFPIAYEKNAKSRRTAFQKIIDHIAAHPIDPVGGVQPAKETA